MPNFKQKNFVYLKLNTPNILYTQKPWPTPKVIPEEKQQVVEEKDADNIKRVLWKKFIQWN